jgi:Protein of unknown function (DUF935)
MPPVSTAGNGTVATRRGRLTGENIAGGSWGAVGNYARSLPQWIDDIGRDFGDDIHERMLTDAQVAAAVTVLKASVLEDGLVLAPAMDDDTDPAYEQATEIMEECERMLDDLQQSLDDVLWDLTDACALGNRLAEQVYEVRAGVVVNKPLLQLASLKTKPRSSYAFVVDAFMNTLGVLGRQPNMSMPAMTPFFDPANPPANFLGPDKIVVNTFRPKNNDPRGTSVLRPAYDSWWRKRQALVDYVKYLAQFAGPSIWATTPEGAQSQPSLDYLANMVDYTLPNALDPLGNPVPVPNAPLSPEQDLLAKLQQFRNGTVAAFPFGTVLNTIQMQGEGRAFLNALAECNIGIVKAILTQELATEEGEHQSRAASQVHQDVLGTLVRQAKRAVVRMFARQVLVPWVKYNWGDDAARLLVPKVSLGTTEEEDKVPMINAVANLFKSGYMHDSQLAQSDTMLGLPVRDLTQDEPVEDSGATPTPPPAAGQSGDSAPNESPDNAQSQDGQQKQQPAQEEEPPPPPNKIKVRPHLRSKPKRRPRAFMRTRVYA